MTLSDFGGAFKNIPLHRRHIFGGVSTGLENSFAWFLTLRIHQKV